MILIEKRAELVTLAHELGVRPDWHEPDEQGLTAVVRGSRFDNAGFWPTEDLVTDDRELVELHVRIYRQDEDDDRPVTDTEPVAVINLATLLAWACGHQSDLQEVYERGYNVGRIHGRDQASAGSIRVEVLREAAAILTGLANSAEESLPATGQVVS